jgi:predicted MPP superfamily phosphohydrolase
MERLIAALSSGPPLLGVLPPEGGANGVAWILTCLGHLSLMIACHNWWYGQPFPKKLGDVIHLGHALLVVGFPLGLYLLVGWDILGLYTFPSGPWTWREALAVYVMLCWLAGGVVVPVITLQRWQRLDPTVDRQAEVIDVAEQLGYRPEGTGREAFLTRLPGNETFQVEFVERTLCPPRLPRAWDGLTILHLSDLHFNGTPAEAFFRWVVERCNQWGPDLIALTGDIADSLDEQEWILPILSQLRSRVAGFAILGNHDFWYEPDLIRTYVNEAGLTMLGNSWQQIKVRGLPLVVVGHEGPWDRPAPNLSSCPTDPFRLCLSHTPDNIAWARRAGIDLMLSGHVHGGQIRLPGIGSLLVPSVYGRRYDCGTFAEGPTLLHVSRGLSGEHPLRYFCRPEVTLLRLGHQEP